MYQNNYAHLCYSSACRGKTQSSQFSHAVTGQVMHAQQYSLDQHTCGNILHPLYSVLALCLIQTTHTLQTMLKLIGI